MRTANNNFTVEALVAKYRNYVKEHCPMAVDWCESGEILTPMSPDADADEQLLVTLYSIVAGNDADKQVLAALSQYGQKFMKAGLEQEELDFLCEHFKEVVAYEFTNRNSWVSRHPWGSHVPSHIFYVVKNMAKPEIGQTIFVADASYGDVAALFPDCTVKGFTGYCGSTILYNETWALGQIRLYASGVNSEIVAGFLNEENNEYTYTLPEEGSVDMVIYGTLWDSECRDLQQLYNLLKEGGKMLIFADRKKLVGKGDEFALRQQLVNDRSIHTILSFEEDGFNGFPEEIFFLYIEKVANKEVHLVDVKRDTSKVIDFDLLNPEILWPNYYEIDRPKNGVPLSKIVTIKDKKLVRIGIGGQIALPDFAKDMPLILPHHLSDTYMEANLQGKCVNAPNDPASKKDRLRFRMANEPCVLISGSTKELRVAYTTKVENGFIYSKSCCLVPQEGIDVRYVAALLFEPSVKEQILTICDGNVTSMLPLVLDKIIVPDHSEKERLSYLAEANYEALVSSQEILKQEAEHYRKAVRMRKHALTQSLSAVEAVFYALNAYRKRQNGIISNNDRISRVKNTTVQEAFDSISEILNNMMPALEHIADVDYSFGKSEWIDPEKSIEDYIANKENGWLNFKPIITWEKGNNMAKKDIKDEKGEVLIAQGNPLNVFLFPKKALEHIFANIIANAQAHGFTDESRKDYQLKFSWHTDGLSLAIEIENNGTPIPDDRDTASLLEYGVSSDLHHNGNNGIGCNEIDDIMKRYDGKVEIVSSPQNDYTVKYVLTFNHTNTVSIM